MPGISHEKVPCGETYLTYEGERLSDEAERLSDPIPIFNPCV